MPDLRERLYATWIARLGRSRVAEIANAGTTLAEKADAIVSSLRPAALDALLVDGFFHHFHQSVYVRTLARGAASLRDVDRRQTGSGVRVKLEDAGSLLLMVSQDIEFLPSDGTPFKEKIDFPVLIRGGGGTLVIQVITMQSDVETWSEIVDTPVRRILTPVSSDRIHDQVLDFLNGTLGVRFGGYIDYSARAIEFIQEFPVDTFSGRYEVGTAGVSTHETVGVVGGRRPLREAMPADFRRLVDHPRIVKLEVKLTEDHRGLAKGSSLLLYPTAGKLVVRANLDRGDLHDFVASLA